MEVDPSYPPSAATWRFYLDRRRHALLERRAKLEANTNECLQLEASLTELEAENLAATRRLREREILLRQARDALEQRKSQREQALAAVRRDEERLLRDAHFEERKLENACHKLESEKRDAATQHDATMEALVAQQQQLETSEQATLAHLYELADVELELAARARRVESSRDAAQKVLQDTVAQLERELQLVSALAASR